jgi:hypothetical protein
VTQAERERETMPPGRDHAACERYLENIRTLGSEWAACLELLQEKRAVAVGERDDFALTDL